MAYISFISPSRARSFPVFISTCGFNGALKNVMTLLYREIHLLRNVPYRRG